MAEKKRGLRDLFGRSSAEPPPYADGATAGRILPTLDGLVECEVALGSTVFTDLPELAAQRGPRQVALRPDAAGAFSAAYGAALAGRRASAVIRAGESPGTIADRLRAAVARHAPCVVFAVIADEACLAAMHAAGAPVSVARDPSHLLDLALVARRLAESALTPVVVAVEQREVARAIADLRLPPAGLIGELLGRPDDAIDCPFAAQQVLFGERRRRVPRWFDLDRPTAHGLRLSGAEAAAAAEGRRAFFAATVGPALSAAVEAFAVLTGRDAGMITRHGPADARHVVLAGGAAVEAARLAAEGLRERIGIVGVNWRLPEAAEKAARALARAQTVSALERGLDAPAAWDAEVRVRLGSGGPVWVRAVYDRPTPAAMRAVLRNALAAQGPREEIHVGVRPPTTETAFPKRQAMLHRLRRDFPELERRAAPDDEVHDARPPGSRTLAVVLEAATSPERELIPWIERMAGKYGAHVRGRSRPVDRGLWEVRATLAGAAFADPGEDAPVDVLLIADLHRALPSDVLGGMAGGGTVLVATALDAERFGAALPGPWRDAIGGLALRPYRVARGADRRSTLDALASAAEAVLRGEAAGLDGVGLAELDEGERIARSPVLPLAVRRFGEAGETYDNVARFWGEMAQPRLKEAAVAAVPDPYLASASVPACTSTLLDATPGRERVPAIEIARCTGCGRCWSSCPDSAIGAVALPTSTLLDFAADRAAAGTASGEAAAKLRRGHKQLAARVDAALARARASALDGDTLREAFGGIVDKMAGSADERAELERAFDATAAAVGALPLAATDAFFHEPQAASKGSGELLMLAVNPHACQGCGICASVCPAAAIRREPQTRGAVEAMRELWGVWERLPDTAGATIARLADHPEVGPLAAILLSRHCALSLAGGGAEPGSGERVAVRQVVAIVEFEMQRRLLGHVGELDALGADLREAIRATLAGAVAVEDLGRLDEALGRVGASRAAASELMEQLARAGEAPQVDLPRVRRLVELARDVERTRHAVAAGAHGNGRARYGVALSGAAARDWAGTFPGNPFSVPLAVDLAGDGAEVAIGLAGSLLAARVEEARLVRRARLWLESPSDLRARERELEALDEHGLTSEERALCPPLLVLADAEAAAGDGLARVLASDLPVKLLCLDGCDPRVSPSSVALRALAWRRGFVLSTSIAHPRQSFDGVVAALRHGGAALIHVHAPSPRRHGFPTELTVERAARAVDCRVHPLLRYDPAAEGLFGLRLSLDGNPAPERAWAEDQDGQDWTPARWAAGERRFEPSDLLSDARGSTQPTVPGPNGRSPALGEISSAAANRVAEVWGTLQELAGVVTPFTGAVRDRAARELRQAHEAELAALRREHEERLAALERDRQAAEAERLKRRLLELAGYGGRR